MALGSEVPNIFGFMALTITTTRQTNGAIALFYPGVKDSSRGNDSSCELLFLASCHTKWNMLEWEERNYVG